jgi:hypothetical protein
MSEFDYMEKIEVEDKDKVWCKIGPTGELDIFNWAFVEKVAEEYDQSGPLTPKTHPQILCKLAVLVRKQTLERAAELLVKYGTHSAESSIVVVKDPLSEEV